MQPARTDRSADLAAWAGIFAGPAAWFLDQQVSYVLVHSACVSGSRLIVPLVSLVAVLLALAGGWMSWRAWRRDAGPVPPRSRGRHRFVAGLGIMLAGLFALVIVAQGIAGIVFTGCER